MIRPKPCNTCHLMPILRNVGDMKQYRVMTCPNCWLSVSRDHASVTIRGAVKEWNKLINMRERRKV